MGRGALPRRNSPSYGNPLGGAAFASYLSVDDCQLNGNTSLLNLDPGLRGWTARGYDDGDRGLDQDTNMLSVTLNWDASENLTFTSVTGWVDLSHDELDDYSGGAGVFGGLHFNDYESLSLGNTVEL